MTSGPVLGIDIGKRSCHAALLINGKQFEKVFSNDPSGFRHLNAFIEKNIDGPIPVCMEATGILANPLAQFLHDAGHKVSMVNPSRIKAFAGSELLRTKTDRVDAALIARFHRAHTPRAWQPPAPELQELQELLRRLDSLQSMLAEERNRLETAGGSRIVRRSIGTNIKGLERQYSSLEKCIAEHVDRHPEVKRRKTLLKTIKGVGDLTALRLLAELQGVTHFENAKQVVAFVGLSPRHHQSGTSVRGRTRLAKTGNPRLRQALFFPAINAARFNPVLRGFAETLAAAGKPRMVIVCAVMRKLLHLAFAILRSGAPFSVNYGTANA